MYTSFARAQPWMLVKEETKTLLHDVRWTAEEKLAALDSMYRALKVWSF